MRRFLLILLLATACTQKPAPQPTPIAKAPSTYPPCDTTHLVLHCGNDRVCTDQTPGAATPCMLQRAPLKWMLRPESCATPQAPRENGRGFKPCPSGCQTLKGEAARAFCDCCDGNGKPLAMR